MHQKNEVNPEKSEFQVLKMKELQNQATKKT